MPGRPLSVKVTVAVLAALLSIGGVAAAAGVFPAPAQPAADHGPDSPGSGPATPGRGDAATTTAAAGNRERGSDTATGPDASGPAKHGLCRAWQAGQGKDKNEKQYRKREDSPAFRALAVAAGGADKIAAYCQATTPGRSADRGTERGDGNG